jgi:hypothetical protein
MSTAQPFDDGWRLAGVSGWPRPAVDLSFEHSKPAALADDYAV